MCIIYLYAYSRVTYVYILHDLIVYVVEVNIDMLAIRKYLLTCIHTQAHTCARARTHMCARSRTHTYICMYVCILFAKTFLKHTTKLPSSRSLIQKLLVYLN